MRSLTLLLTSVLALAAAPPEDKVVVTVAPFEKDRRWVLVELDARGKTLPGDAVVDEKGGVIEGQTTPVGVAWLVPFIPAGRPPRSTSTTSRSSGRSWSAVSTCCAGGPWSPGTATRRTTRTTRGCTSH